MVFRDSQRQTCKACGRPDGFNFHVPDGLWLAVVPPEYQKRALCLLCFDQFAVRAKKDYPPHITDILFVGCGAHFDFSVKRRLWAA